MASVEELIQDYERAISRIILYCVAELPFPLGIGKTVSLLKGSKSTFIIDYKLHSLGTYSILSTFTRRQLRAMIEALVKAEFLEVEFAGEYENMPVLKMAPKGRDLIAGKYQASAKFIEDFVDRSIPELDEGEEVLFGKLRKLRRAIALQRDIPAFMICGDATLRALTKQKPTDTTSLLAVRGIGERFVENYGDKFIEVMTDPSHA